MMTNNIGVVDKSTMIKIHSKEDILAMLNQIRIITGWSRDKCMREAGVKEQTGKDWFRKNKDINPTHADIVRITNLYDKVAQKQPANKMETARRQLDSAIEIWFNEGDIIAIRTLSTAAYEEIYELGVVNNIKLPALINNENVEGVLFFAVAALQAIGGKLNEVEQAFYSWLSIQDPKLFAESSRIFLRSIAPLNSNVSRQEFFSRFIGKRG